MDVISLLLLLLLHFFFYGYAVFSTSEALKALPFTHLPLALAGWKDCLASDRTDRRGLFLGYYYVDRE